MQDDTNKRTTTMEVANKKITVGLDLGDKYTHLCLLDTNSAEVVAEGRLRTTPDAFARRFASDEPMRIAIA